MKATTKPPQAPAKEKQQQQYSQHTHTYTYTYPPTTPPPHTQYDGHFHLDTVEKHEFSGGTLPTRVHTKKVGGPWFHYQPLCIVMCIVMCALMLCCALILCCAHIVLCSYCVTYTPHPTPTHTHTHLFKRLGACSMIKMHHHWVIQRGICRTRPVLCAKHLHCNGEEFIV